MPMRGYLRKSVITHSGTKEGPGRSARKMSAKIIRTAPALILCVVLSFRTISAVHLIEVPPHLRNSSSSDNAQNESLENDALEGTEGFRTTAEASEVTTILYDQQRKHPCNRKCVKGSEPMICRYDFQVEHYQTMSKACYDCPFNPRQCNLKDCIPADGVKKALIVVNRQLPGPSIEVCHGDTVEVRVENQLFEETTSIHWHGQHQKGFQFMDGVPKITQCPIPPESEFTYRFNASVAGTHFWHSHSGFQRGDGAYGSLIVRKPLSEDQFADFYDFDLSEHILNVVDWIHMSGISKYVAHHHSDGDNKPINILVNGKGRYQEFEDEHGRVLFTPLEKFTVTKGYRYRFRLINSGSLNCPIEISVDNHTLVIIAGDGADLEPVEASSLVSYAGERFDFIIEMDQPIDNYWMRFRGLMDCDERFHSVFQSAILHYEGANEETDPTGKTSYDIIPRGLQVNSLNTPLNTTDSLITSELRSARSSRRDPRLKPEPDVKFYISYDFYPKDNDHYHLSRHYGFNQTEKSQRVYTPQLNYITMKFPPFTLLSNPREADKLEFCNSSTIPKECEAKFCECIHLLNVPKNAVVELIIIDKGFVYDANHPFHLHGYNFRVIGMDRLGQNVTEEKIRELDEGNRLMRNLEEAPIKDTVTVPDGGYTIIRWHATNPGFWLFHCHIEFHMEIGMALVFKVGEESDYPPTPKNFPKCHNFIPVETEETTAGNEPNTESDDEDIITNEIINIYFNGEREIASKLNGNNSGSLTIIKTSSMSLLSSLTILYFYLNTQYLHFFISNMIFQ